MSDVTDLSIRAFKRIKMFSEDRTPGEFRMREAVEHLNLIIDSLNNSTQNIPILSTIEFNTVAGQRSYRIGNDVSYDIVKNKPITIDYVRINDAGTVYILDKSDINSFYTSYINETRKRRPTWFFGREGTDYMDLIFFELPDKEYACTIECSLSFSHITSNSNLDEFPPRYLNYLTWQLSKDLQSIYPSQPWTANSESQYKDAKKDIKNKSSLDLSVKYVAGAKIPTKYNRRYNRNGRY